MKYVIGLLLIAAGALLVWKSEPIYQFTGAMESAERWFGPGQTRLMIKLIGIALIIVSFLIMTGAIQGLLTTIFVPRQGF